MGQFPCPSCASVFNTEYRLNNHVAAVHTRLFTADSYLIVDRMPVWNYNLDLVTVDLSTAQAETNGDVWFQTKTPEGGRGPLMNGERLVTRHPSTGQSATDAMARIATSQGKVTVDVTWSDGSSYQWVAVPEKMVEEIRILLGRAADTRKV